MTGTQAAAPEAFAVNLDGRSKSDVYTLVTSLVVPRPIAWVSTVSPSGTPNLAPYSYFNLVADDPVHVAFSSIGIKDTLRNITGSGEFVVNLANWALAAALDATAEAAAPEVDEFALAGVTPVPSDRVRPPRVAEAPAALECELADVVPIGNGNLVIGRAVRLHVAAALWRDGHVDPVAYDPLLRLSRRYGRLSRSVTQEEKPGWLRWQANRDGFRTEED
jgi:flavin reductase (DIM6/NTAB) family NADH-FMN oxidoreductase RutF